MSQTLDHWYLIFHCCFISDSNNHDDAILCGNDGRICSLHFMHRAMRTDLSEYICSMDVYQIAQHMQMQAERIQMQAFPAFKDTGRRFSLIKSTASQA